MLLHHAHEDEPMKCLMISLLLMCSAVVQAETSPVESVCIQGFGTVPYQMLFEAKSETGESLDDFILRVAPKMRDYTVNEGFEACGVIASDNAGNFGVVIGTNLGHTVCANFSGKVPAGMTATGQTVHSHTTMTKYRATQADLLVMGSRTKRGQVVRGDDPEIFSEEDFEAPGYMVSGTRLWHQAGKRTVRGVGALP